MLSAIDEKRAVSSAHLLRTQHKSVQKKPGTCLIVEGDNDIRFFENLIDPQECFLVSANGRLNAVKALSILECQGYAGVLAVVDADYERIRGIPPPSENVLLTDHHDVETMLLVSPALEKLLRSVLPAHQIRLASELAAELRKRLLKSGTVVGCLRLLSQNRGLWLKFEGLKLSTLVRDDGTVDPGDLVREVVRLTPGCRLSQATLKKLLVQARLDDCDPWEVCCGHDLTDALVVTLPGAIHEFALNPSQDRLRDEAGSQHVIERRLPLYYEALHFRRTRLYGAISAWETQHVGYSVLPRNP